MYPSAEGLATRTAFELPQQIMWELLDDFEAVSDDEIRSAQAQMMQTTRNLLEGDGDSRVALARGARTPGGAAGAAPLALAVRLRVQLAGRRVVLVASGGNASLEQLRDVLP